MDDGKPCKSLGIQIFSDFRMVGSAQKGLEINSLLSTITKPEVDRIRRDVLSLNHIYNGIIIELIAYNSEIFIKFRHV